jgi:SAM-dependent methyltransferase
VPFTLRNLKEDLEDLGSNFDGPPDLEFRAATKALELEESGLTYQRVPPGYRFPYGHTHKTQEEVYVVVRGSGRMKLDDEIVDLREWDAVRVAPGTWRGYEAGPEGLEILVIGAPNLGENPRDDVEGTRDWWAGSFDPVAYKETTRDQWQDAAAAWDRWGEVIEGWLGPATEVMLDMAGIGEGSRVLDVAAGTGGQSFAAARRVGPGGSVLATDLSSNLLDFAARRAREAGLDNVETAVLDGEHLDVEEASFDAIICRLGFMYFPDQQAAFRGMWRALKPGGRLAGIVYSTAQANEFFSVPVSIIRRRAELRPPAPGQPGPFSFGEPGVLEGAYERAGFSAVETRRMAAPLRLASTAECLRFEQESFGALHQMLAGLSDDGRADAWAEIEQALGRFEQDGRFEAPCEIIIAAGAR